MRGIAPIAPYILEQPDPEIETARSKTNFTIIPEEAMV
jgi:hypothetical protein